MEKSVVDMMDHEKGGQKIKKNDIEQAKDNHPAIHRQ